MLKPAQTSGGVLDHGFQKAHGFRIQKYGLIAFPVTYRSCPETVGDHLLRWIRAVAAVVVRWKVFSSHRRGWFFVCYLFLDSYEEREERVRWLRWYLGNVSHAGPEFPWRGMSGW